MRKLLHEPLAHFLLLGAALFGIYALVGDRASDRTGEIVVTRGQIEQLVMGFSRTWQRPPTQQELKGLIEDYIREEVLYREAVALELDRDDTLVRRRMRQKLEFLTEDGASQAAPPTEAELEAHLQQHADHYREQPRLSFEHILFSRQRRGKSAEADAQATLARLKGRSGSAIDTESLGDAFLLPFHYQRSSTEEITQLFGGSFGQQVAEVEPGPWAGPFESSYGLHLVRVHEKIPGKVPALAEIRETVERDLLQLRRQQALEAAYQRLREQYTVGSIKEARAR